MISVHHHNSITIQIPGPCGEVEYLSLIRFQYSNVWSQLIVCAVPFISVPETRPISCGRVYMRRRFPFCAGDASSIMSQSVNVKALKKEKKEKKKKRYFRLLYRSFFALSLCTRPRLSSAVSSTAVATTGSQ